MLCPRKSLPKVDNDCILSLLLVERAVSSMVNISSFEEVWFRDRANIQIGHSRKTSIKKHKKSFLLFIGTKIQETSFLTTLETIFLFGLKKCFFAKLKNENSENLKNLIVSKKHIIHLELLATWLMRLS
jgi:hypothetical protein